MKYVQEGEATIIIPDLPDKISSGMTVFYNPDMRVNRDIAVMCVEFLHKKCSREMALADPMAASGVRAVRWLKDISSNCTVYVNDINGAATRITEENFRLNGIPYNRYKVFQQDANLFLRERRGFGFDYIDIDPFGTPVPFIEAAIISLTKGGIVGVTATDTAPLSGTFPNTCLRRYGAKPLRNEFKHEAGIRILIRKIIEIGAQHDIAMVPLFAYSHLHYFRVFLTKQRGAKKTDILLEDIGYLLYCFNCTNRKIIRNIMKVQEKCHSCGARFSISGPMWLGKLWDKDFTEFIHNLSLKANYIHKHTKKLLQIIYKESKVNTVGFYTLSKLSQKTSMSSQPPIKIVDDTFNGVRTHFEGDGFRTTLPHDEVLRRFKSLKGYNRNSRA